jgi:tRNA-specific 2-thiouridylase
VDSSVTAALLHEAGYDVVGMTLQLYDHGMALAKKGACCAGQDIYDARMVAENCGFPHYVLDYESRFREQVIDDFADAYARGETPIPCVRCNQTVKFTDLLQTARDLDADALATGHYVKRATDPQGRPALFRATDDGKDQSYFLFATTRDQLDFLRFPLGDLDKAETRRQGLRLGLTIADKPDSQDICFVPDGDYAKIVRKLRPESADAGDIVHLDGTVLGRHQGIIHYTIGQRRGIGIGGRDQSSDPLYVIRLDPDACRVVVGPKSALATPDINLTDVNWLGVDRLSDGPHPVQVKIRNTMAPVRASVEATALGDVAVRFAEPQHGVSPGQACVFYAAEDGTRLLGGGWIARKAERAAA